MKATSENVLLVVAGFIYVLSFVVVTVYAKAYKSYVCCFYYYNTAIKLILL